MKSLALITALAATALLGACSSSSKTTEAPAAAATTTAPAAKDAKGTKKAAAKPAAATSTGEAETAVTCTHGDVKRELKLLKTSERCSVEYTKDGATQEIASGFRNSSFCGETLTRVKNNLTAAGYTCE